MKNKLLLFLCLFGSLQCIGQESYLRHYGRREGLPSVETYSVMQDHKGFIWIASDMGAVRFDGYHFKVFTTSDGLTDNTVFRFYEDYKGRIWFYTFSGKLCFYYNDTIYGKDWPINEKIRSFLGSGWVTDILIDEKDTIFLASQHGGLKAIPSKASNETWTRLEVFSNKETHLLRGGYLTMEELKDKRVKLMRHTVRSPSKEIILTPKVPALTEYGKCGTHGSALFFDDKGFFWDDDGNLDSFNAEATVISYWYENDSAIWIGKKCGGVSVLNGANRRHPIRKILMPYSVTCMTKDREGGYWLSTLEDGIFYMPSVNFMYFSLGDNKASKSFLLSNHSLHSLDSAHILELTKHRILSSSGKSWQAPALSFPSRIAGKEDTMILDMYQHPNGEIWVSGSSGIAIFNASLKNILHVIRTQIGINDFDSRFLFMDHKLNVWSLNHNSLIQFDYKTKKALKAYEIPSRAETACEDYQGNILIGTLNGLYRTNGDSLAFLGTTSKVLRNRVTDIQKVHGKVICATQGAGLVILSKGYIRQISTAHGLPSDMCRSIFVSSDTTIWTATNRGVCLIDISNIDSAKVIRTLTESDGLTSDDNFQILKNGPVLWLLSKNGITAFNVDNIFSSNIPPPVYITDFFLDGAPFKNKGIPEIPYSTKFIEIGYVGITYRSSGLQKYEYRLLGYDSSFTSSRNTLVQFTKLPPGKYTFEVRCVNNSGIASSIPARISFRITEPFYLQWWFNLLVLMIFMSLLLLLGLAYFIRIRNKEREKTRINTRMAYLELQALRAQMNPHFIFNCLNAIQDFILSQDIQSARKYLSAFAKLMRMTLENSRRQSIRLSDEIDFLDLYLKLEKMRFSDKFDYSIDISQGLDPEEVVIPSMILQPFVENAIRHGKIAHLPYQGILTLQFQTDKNYLVCNIRDNGIGLNKSLDMKRNSFSEARVHAIDIINERIKAINEISDMKVHYILMDRSEEAVPTNGTMVIIYISISNKKI